MSVSQNQYVVRNHHGYLRFCFYAAERRIRGFIESRPEQATWFDEEAACLSQGGGLWRRGLSWLSESHRFLTLSAWLIVPE
jgi:hypothetical protein